MSINTKKIRALEVTDEKVYNSKIMKDIVEDVLNNPDYNIQYFLGDGSVQYWKILDGRRRKRFGLLSKLKVIQSFHLKEQQVTYREVRYQTKDLLKLKKKRTYDGCARGCVNGSNCIFFYQDNRLMNTPMQPGFKSL